MTTKRRRRFTADFKKRVALEALRGDRTVQAIAAKHEVHPNQVGTWKRQAVEGLDEVFARGGSPGPSEHEATIRDLHAKIGELTMERDFSHPCICDLPPRCWFRQQRGTQAGHRQPAKCAVFGCHEWEIYSCHQHRPHRETTPANNPAATQT